MRDGGPLCNRRELFDRYTGLIAALFYSVFQPFWAWKNLTFDAEMLMNLPIIWAWAIAFRRGSSRLRPELFLAGALLGAAFLLKQPAAIAAVPLGIYLLLPSYRASRSLTRTNSIIQAAMLTAGFFAALSLVTIVLWKQGILHARSTGQLPIMMFRTFLAQGNREYADLRCSLFAFGERGDIGVPG